MLPRIFCYLQLEHLLRGSDLVRGIAVHLSPEKVQNVVMNPIISR